MRGTYGFLSSSNLAAMFFHLHATNGRSTPPLLDGSLDTPTPRSKDFESPPLV